MKFLKGERGPNERFKSKIYFFKYLKKTLYLHFILLLNIKNKNYNVRDRFQ